MHTIGQTWSTSHADHAVESTTVALIDREVGHDPL